MADTLRSYPKNFLQAIMKKIVVPRKWGNQFRIALYMRKGALFSSNTGLLKLRSHT